MKRYHHSLPAVLAVTVTCILACKFCLGVQGCSVAWSKVCTSLHGQGQQTKLNSSQILFQCFMINAACCRMLCIHLGLGAEAWQGGRSPHPSTDLFLWAFVKAIWLPGAYPTVLMAAKLGSFQAQASSVHAVPLSLITAASKAYSMAPTCEHTSPNPAIQVQWPNRTRPSFSKATQAVSGGSFKL